MVDMQWNAQRKQWEERKAAMNDENGKLLQEIAVITGNVKETTDEYNEIKEEEKALIARDSVMKHKIEQSLVMFVL